MSLFVILLFAALDRLVGWKLGPGVVRLLLVPVVFAGIGFAVGQPNALDAMVFGLQWGVPFLIWRDPKWTTFGGELDPTVDRYPETVARHLLSLIFMWPLYLIDVSPIYSAPCLFIFALLAAGLARCNRMYPKKPFDGATELARGALLGCALCVSCRLATGPTPV